MFRLIHEKVQAERACTFIRYLRVVEQTFNLGVGPNGRIHTFNLNSWRATFTYNVYYGYVVCTYNVHTLHTIKVVSSQNHALKLEFCKAKLYRLNRKPISSIYLLKFLNSIKFSFSEKAKNICAIFLMVLTFTK